MLKPEYIIIHHSDSEWGDADEITKWHLARGFNDIGYHFVITNGYPEHVNLREKKYKQASDGYIELGRDVNVVGAHCKDLNSKSLGVCFIGSFDKGKPTDRQLKMGARQVAYLCDKYNIPVENVLGHGEANLKVLKKKLAGTDCPGKNFDLNAFRQSIKDEMNRVKDPMDMKERFKSALDFIGEIEQPIDEKALTALASADLDKVIKEFNKFVEATKDCKVIWDPTISEKIEDLELILANIKAMIEDHQTYIPKRVMENGDKINEMRLSILLNYRPKSET